jgi:hypothetical protein
MFTPCPLKEVKYSRLLTPGYFFPSFKIIFTYAVFEKSEEKNISQRCLLAVTTMRPVLGGMEPRLSATNAMVCVFVSLLLKLYFKGVIDKSALVKTSRLLSVSVIESPSTTPLSNSCISAASASMMISLMRESLRSWYAGAGFLWWWQLWQRSLL